MNKITAVSLFVCLILLDHYTILLSAGEHSQLIKDIVIEFGSRYFSGGSLVYAGDTGNKHGFFDIELLASLGVELDNHGKLPDVVIYNPEKNWLFLIEAVTSHGPLDHKRYGELNSLFQNCTAGLVFVSAFPNTKNYVKYSGIIAWETEVWMADNPSHMIHFNGSRFMGPYSNLALYKNLYKKGSFKLPFPILEIV